MAKRELSFDDVRYLAHLATQGLSWGQARQLITVTKPVYYRVRAAALLPAQTHLDMMAAYTEGRPVREIARAFGIEQTVCSMLLRMHGIDVKLAGAKPTPRSTRLSMLETYLEGVSVEHTAKLHGCGIKAVQSALRASSICARKPTEQPRPRPVITDGRKACRKCKQWKPLTMFSAKAECFGGRAQTCKDCNGARVSKHKRRANRLRAGGIWTKPQFDALCSRYGHVCLRCKRRGALAADHIIPLTVVGSSNAIHNIQPLCHHCNSKKNVKIIDYRPDHSSVLPWAP